MEANLAPHPTPPRRRLLVLASTYPRWAGDHEPGFVHHLSRRLTSAFDVTVLCPHAPNAALRETLDGVEVIRYRYAPARMERLVNDGGIVTNLRRHPWMLILVPGFVLAQWWVARRVVRRWQPDVVHAHWLLPQGLIASLLGSGRRPTPVFMVTSHGADLFALRARPLQWLKQHVADRAARLTVVSDAMRDELERLGVDVGRVSVEPMGVDMLDLFKPDPNVEREPRQILFVGRLVEKKGVRHLLEAMPQVLRDEPTTTLVIAGFGPEREALERRAESLGLNAAVQFIGPVRQSELPRLYQRAALLVAPFVEATSGDQEGLGLVAVEALGCGCPVVAGDVIAARQAFRGLEAVHLVNARDPTALAAAMISSLRRNAAVDESDLAEARRRFDWISRSRAYARLLNEAAASVPAQHSP